MLLTALHPDARAVRRECDHTDHLSHDVVSGFVDVVSRAVVSSREAEQWVRPRSLDNLLSARRSNAALKALSTIATSAPRLDRSALDEIGHGLGVWRLRLQSSFIGALLLVMRRRV
jgi:hypothetical protein